MRPRITVPSDDELWQRRSLSVSRLAVELQVDRGVLSERLRDRGFVRRNVGGRYRLVKAPCRGCDRPTSTARLSRGRECPSCEGPGSRRLRLERELSRARRSARRPGGWVGGNG